MARWVVRGQGRARPPTTSTSSPPNDRSMQQGSDAKLDPFLGRRGFVALGHSSLDLDGTTHRVNHALELRQEAVAGVLYDPAPVPGDFGVDQFPEVRGHPLMRPLLIGPHEARIPRHI